MATYDADDDHGTTQVRTNPGLVTYTHVMYALHAFAVVMGILTSASIVGQFIFSVPSIVAVVMNYVRRGEARGTWLESHFRWQLRTFWVVVIACLIAWLLFGWLVVIFIGLIPIWIVYVLAGLWAAYRIVRGWLALNARKPMRS
jgi:uncharacterized membrane protein